MQNLLAFRFSNGMFEPLWNKNHIDHIQFNVSEAVDVEGRGGYYDTSGVLRDMMQNHMFQMLAYLCMEPPGSFEPDAIRNEKAKLLEAGAHLHAGGGARSTPSAASTAPARRRRQAGGRLPPGEGRQPAVEHRDLRRRCKLFIDNWRWEGVPIYLRSGKALWKRGTEIVVQFKKAPEVIFRGTPVHGARRRTGSSSTSSRTRASRSGSRPRSPGPRMQLQPVNMRFNYGDAFKASRDTGYEVMLYSCIARRRDAVLAQRPGRGRLADRAADPRPLGRRPPATSSRTTSAARGDRRPPPT